MAQFEPQYNSSNTILIKIANFFVSHICYVELVVVVVSVVKV